MDNLKGIDGLKLNYVKKDTEPNYAYFPIVIDEKIFGKDRNYVFKKLQENNIFSRKYFYPLTNTFDCFGGKYNAELTPNALYISGRVLTLPMYADLQFDDIDRICEIISECKY